MAGVKGFGAVPVLLLVLCGCTSTPTPETTPSGTTPPPSPSPPASPPAFVIPDVPGPGSTTLALSTYQHMRESGTSGRFETEQSAPYAVQAQCLSNTAGRTIRYEATIDGVAVSSGLVPCDGSLYINSAFTGSGDGPATYSIQLSDLREVTRAYAAIVPAPQ